MLSKGCLSVPLGSCHSWYFRVRSLILRPSPGIARHPLPHGEGIGNSPFTMREKVTLSGI